MSYARYVPCFCPKSLGREEKDESATNLWWLRSLISRFSCFLRQAFFRNIWSAQGRVTLHSALTALSVKTGRSGFAELQEVQNAVTVPRYANPMGAF